MNRREFLKGAALAAGGLLLETGCKTGGLRAGKPGRKKDEKVLVLGAGMAGIAAARALERQGFEVLVLEGRDRIGGRIHTDASQGMPLDLGAAWMHGIVQNPVAEIARQQGRKFQLSDFDNLLLKDRDGEEPSEKELKELESKYAGAYKAALASKRRGRKYVSMRKFMKRQSARLDWERGPLQEWALRVQLGDEFGASLEKLSLAAVNEGNELAGGDQLPVGGYGPILKEMAEGLKIRLGVKIKEVNLEEDGVEVLSESETFEADRVICTLPLGILKTGQVKFTPPLPKAKVRAIKRLGFGNLNKVILRYDKQFWPKWPDVIGRYPLDDTPPSYINMAHYSGKPILVGLSGGGKIPDPKKSDQEIISRTAAAFGGLFEHGGEPSSGLVTRWNRDPFALGAYSFLPVGVSPDEREELAEPIKERIFFAGEATSQRFPATVHGAYFSGLREAKNVLEAYEESD